MDQKYAAIQSKQSIQKNISYFRDNLEKYNEDVQSLDSYKIIRQYINKSIDGINVLLDIGNGGVFDYDTRLATKIIGVDLFLDQLSENFQAPANVSMEKGDALNLPYENNVFDGSLMIMLIHHLVGKDVETNFNNMQKAIAEAVRVLKPGGKLIIAESCVPRWFYLFEKAVYPLAVKFIDKFIKHPAAFQYTESILKNTLLEHCSEVKVENVPLARWVLQFGVKFPTAFSPVCVKIFTAIK